MVWLWFNSDLRWKEQLINNNTRISNTSVSVCCICCTELVDSELVDLWNSYGVRRYFILSYYFGHKWHLCKQKKLSCNMGLLNGWGTWMQFASFQASIQHETVPQIQDCPGKSTAMVVKWTTGTSLGHSQKHPTCLFKIGTKSYSLVFCSSFFFPGGMGS